jgi:hypothetical protein
MNSSVDISSGEMALWNTGRNVGGHHFDMGMSISGLRSGRRGPAAVLADAVAVLRELDSTWWSNESDDDLVATVELTERSGRLSRQCRQVGSQRSMPGTWAGRSCTTARRRTGSPTPADCAGMRADDSSGALRR